MRKRIFGRRLKRNTKERKALFRSLMHSMVFYGKIRTTEAKAKSIRGELEKLVTMARDKGEGSRGLLVSKLANSQAVEKLISEIAPKFVSRPGGYTRITRMGPRLKDGARMVLMSWVEEVAPTSFKEQKREKVKPLSSGSAKKEKAPSKKAKTPKKIEKKSGGKK